MREGLNGTQLTQRLRLIKPGKVTTESASTPSKENQKKLTSENASIDDSSPIGIIFCDAPTLKVSSRSTPRDHRLAISQRFIHKPEIK